MPTGRLRKRQQEIYEYICEYSAAHGYPPSVREIGAAVGLRSPSTIHTHLRVLQEFGYIKRDPKKPRALLLTPTVTHQSGTEAIVSAQGSIKLPVVGRVAAGVPILAAQNVEEYMQVPSTIAGDKAAFILQVRGESMKNIGINNNDYIVVQQQDTARNGEIVIALIDNECTVKRFFKEEHYVRLQPENDTMQPIFVENPVILGKVIGLFRRVVS